MLKDFPPQRLWQDDHFNSLVPDTPVNRRGFIAAAIAAGLAVTAEPVPGQAIKTPMDGLEGGDTKVGDIPAYYAVKRGGGKRPVVLVVPEIFGLHEYQKDMCRRLAHAGYFGVSLDPFFRLGDLAKMTEIKQVIGLANQLTDQQAFADLDAVVDWTGKHKRANAAKLGLTGHCRGGRMVWMYSAHQKKIKAAVAWYGSLMPIGTAMPQGPLDVTDKIMPPVLGLYGGADQGIPMAHVERMRAGLLAFGKDKRNPIHVYEGMPHAFHADYRPSYRQQAAEDGWKRMLAWFKKHGVA
ncbi:MAG: dienelactone hydrolase family protein [Betaproteobacteria bacterium]|nr:dienelactone hydrolase family protein [Betaproteobacteria bacterium]